MSVNAWFRKLSSRSQAFRRGGLFPVCPFERSRFAADAVACPKEATSEIRDWESALVEWFVSGYDEAIMSLGFMAGSMNFDLKIALQTLCFSITSKLKSIEIP
jgi:hypothetical protein